VLDKGERAAQAAVGGSRKRSAGRFAQATNRFDSTAFSDALGPSFFEVMQSDYVAVI